MTTPSSQTISPLKPVAVPVEQQKPDNAIENFKQQFQIEGALLMYVGNLESYQGIDLLLDSFATILPAAPNAHLIIIGGKEEDIQKYQAKARQQKTDANVHIVGPRPISNLKRYLEQADILVSPRTKGDNTPMKLYSYLDSGKALVATNLTTHTQVLTDQIAVLAEPTVDAYSQGILRLISDLELRESLGHAARVYIAKEHTYEVFSSKLSSLYDWLQQELTGA